MSERHRHTRPDWPLLIGSLPLVCFLTTLGSFGAWFGLMTQCTNTYDCTTTSCVPCRETSTWLNIGWAVQSVLLLIGTALAVLGARRLHLRAVRLAALLLGRGSILLFAVTTSLAGLSF
ncbi:hypothetical protein ACI798_17925 [Geodermatophilus sp. SYSU D01045]